MGAQSGESGQYSPELEAAIMFEHVAMPTADTIARIQAEATASHGWL